MEIASYRESIWEEGCEDVKRTEVAHNRFHWLAYERDLIYVCCW